jgi:predicted outer membrane repeat protein
MRRAFLRTLAAGGVAAVAVSAGIVLVTGGTGPGGCRTTHSAAGQRPWGLLGDDACDPSSATGPSPQASPGASSDAMARTSGASPGNSSAARGTSSGASPQPSTKASRRVTPGTSSRKANGWKASADCKDPAPLPVPATRVVVGRGTTATCTESALRSAVASGGYVTFDCGGGQVTIPVTKEITTRGTTVIDGGGRITLDGGRGSRIFVVGQDGTLSVRNLRFVNGRATQPGKSELGGGGAIAGFFRTRLEVIGSTFENNAAGMGGGALMIGTEGRLSIVRSLFKGNSSAYGGAVYSLLAPLTVVNSTFTDNSTVTRGGGGEGGAIGTDGGAPPNKDSKGGEIRICGSTLARNSGHGGGGGAFLWGYARDRIIIERTTFRDNTVDGLGGGARVSIGGTDYSSTGTIIISGTSIMSNTSTGNGGGLYVDCLSTCDIENSTFYRNSSKTYGGAVFGDRHHDTNVTFAKNYAGGHGGALFGSRFVLDNTVFVGNSAGNPWGQAMSCSSTGTGSHVVQWLSSSPDKVSRCVAGVRSVDPQLLEPADNGGPTLTMMPAKTSPVLGAGSGCTPRDQRGVVRKGSACDLGAVQRS